MFLLNIDMCCDCWDNLFFDVDHNYFLVDIYQNFLNVGEIIVQ